MKSELHALQDVHIELLPFSLAPYGDRYVVKDRLTKNFIFVDEDELCLIEELKPPGKDAAGKPASRRTTISSLIQLYQHKTGKYSYKKVFELVALLLSASFLTPASRAALTRFGLFKPFAPPRPPRILARFKISAPAGMGRMAAWITSWPVIGILAAMAGFSCFEAYSYSRDPNFAWVAVGGSCIYGILAWVISIYAIFFLKSVFKSVLLTAMGLDVSGSGIRFVRGIPKYVVNDSDILTRGPDATLRFHLSAMLLPAALAIPGLFLFWRTHGDVWCIWSMACLLAIFLDMSPFVHREFMNAMDRLSGKNRMLGTLRTFVHRKYTGRIFLPASRLETRLIGYGFYSYSVIWMFGAYEIITMVMLRHMNDLAYTLHMLDMTIGTAAAAVMAVCILFFRIIGLVISVIRFIGHNLYTLFEKPIDLLLNFISYITHQLRDTSKSEIMEFLNDIPLFAQLPASIRARLAEYMEVRYYWPGRTVVWQGRPGDAFYIIYQGAADVILDKPNGNRVILATLSERDSFGELALIRDVPRTATVKAREGLICFVLQKNLFKQFVQTSLDDKESISRLIQWNTVLKDIPIFVDLPAESMARVILEMSDRHLNKSDVIVREGDTAAEFYILRSGTAEVWKHHGKPEAQKLSTLGPGDYFGEIALFEESPRTASIIATEPCHVLVMSKESFFHILRNNILSGIWAEETAKNRRAEMIARS